jgi:hypothetical protein
MANNLIRIKRTSVSGRAANTSTLQNAGELALNMADGILYSSNGSTIFEIGANNTNVNITGNAAIKAIVANGVIGTAGQVLTSGGVGANIYWSTVSGGGGGESYTFANGVANNSGTVSVVANTGIVANTSGVFVNSAYIGTLSANNASYLGGTAASGYQTTAGLSSNVATLAANSATYLNGNTASDLNTYADNKAANAYSNATSFASNASNITTGTLPYARLGANVVNTSSNFTITGVHTHNANIVLGTSGLSVNGSFGTTGQILTSNGTATYWGSKYTVGSTPPAYPNYGDTWYYTDLEKLFMWINDGGSDYWYDFLPPVA